MPDESRHNLFHFLHKALRYGHCRMLAALGTHDFACETGTAELLATLTQLSGMSRTLLKSARSVLHPAVEARRPGAGAPLDHDYSSHNMALAEIESLIRAVKVATPQRRCIAGRALYRCYALFAAADMARMDAEETDLLSALHGCFADEELRGLEARLFGSLPRDELGTCLQLMMPALSQSERKTFLAQLEHIIAPDDLSALIREGGHPLLPTTEAAAA